MRSNHGRRLGVEFEGTEKISRRTKFSNDLFVEKIPFYRPKFLTTFFSHRSILSVSTVLNRKYNIYDPFSLQKTSISQKMFSSFTPCFSQLVLCLTSNNSTSQNIGGTDAWAVPHLKFEGTFPQSP